MLIVMSEQANTNGGLLLAASPTAKRVLGITNVMRKRVVPMTLGDNYCPNTDESLYSRKSENK